MKKKVFIIHGWDGSPDETMLYWLKTSLEKENFEVRSPKMPNPDKPEIKPWIEKLKEIVKHPNENTFFICHSVGCQAILRFLETLPEKSKVGGLVLIAPWLHLNQQTIEEEGPEVAEIAKPWIETPIDFEKISLIAEKIVAIFSDDDPYVTPINKEIFQKKLGAKIITEHKKGHFNEDSAVTDLPSALNELLKMAKE